MSSDFSHCRSLSPPPKPQYAWLSLVTPKREELRRPIKRDMTPKLTLHRYLLNKLLPRWKRVQNPPINPEPHRSVILKVLHEIYKPRLVTEESIRKDKEEEIELTKESKKRKRVRFAERTAAKASVRKVMARKSFDRQVRKAQRDGRDFKKELGWKDLQPQKKRKRRHDDPARSRLWYAYTGTV